MLPWKAERPQISDGTSIRERLMIAGVGPSYAENPCSPGGLHVEMESIEWRSTSSVSSEGTQGTQGSRVSARPASLARMAKFIDINGAKLAYEMIGPDDGPLIITLHGGRGRGDHKSDFKAYSLLSDRHRVLSFDMRGHGQSSETKPYTFNQMVEDVEGLRQSFQEPNEQVILIGGSFGGFIAQKYAFKYPSRVSHLILRGTAPSYHHEEEALCVLEEKLHLVPTISINMLKNKIFGKYSSDMEFRLIMHAVSPLCSETFDADAALKKNLETVYRAETHAALYLVGEKYFDYRDELHKITAKTLIIVGENDWICPPKQSELMVSRIPRATLRVIRNANHNVHLERNKEVIRHIRAHLML